MEKNPELRQWRFKLSNLTCRCTVAAAQQLNSVVRHQMGSTFVGINENGFWMRDCFLELWLRFAALHIEDTVEDQSLAHTIRNEWLLASRGYFGGAVPFRIEENISTAEGKTIVLKAFESLLSALRTGPEFLAAGVVNLMGVDSWGKDIEARRLIQVGESLVQLIEGKKFAGPEDSSYMPGSTT